MDRRTYDPRRIQTARRTRRWRQSDLADAMGVARNTICRAEQGQVSDAMVARIAEALDLEPEFFYAQPEQADPDEARLLAYWRTLSPAARGYVHAFLAGLAAAERERPERSSPPAA
jgi:transcriptional regulator with XRE-family HTH domain